MKTKITVMLIMAQERRLPLLEALESCGIDVLLVCNCNQGRRMLEIQPQVQVVLTDAALPDGDWREVLQIVAQAGVNIEVVVSSRLGDYKLWIDVLEHGAYDVLVEPYESEESATNAIGSREEPIKYLVNTHNHFDHDDGIRTYVADGATIITNAMNFGENNLDFGDENESDDSKVL